MVRILNLTFLFNLLPNTILTIEPYTYDSFILNYYKGSMRSAESIKTKIARVMASYKEANERLNSTGSRLKGLAHTNFQEFVVTNICKYYFQLDPVMKNRKNVYAWHTNEMNKKIKTRLTQTTISTKEKLDLFFYQVMKKIPQIVATT